VVNRNRNIIHSFYKIPVSHFYLLPNLNCLIICFHPQFEFIRNASAMILSYSSFASSLAHTTHRFTSGWMLRHRSSHRVSWIVLATSCVLLLLRLQPMSGATMSVVSRRESTTTCVIADPCSCFPEPIEEDSCGVSNTTDCFKECSDQYDTCSAPCLEYQQVCLDSCLLDVAIGNADAFSGFQCSCDCLGIAYDCINPCTSAYNGCACECESSNGTSSSFLGYTTVIRTSMAALFAVFWYM
jgi:hypothetical protein